MMNPPDPEDFISNVQLRDNLNVCYPRLDEIFTNTKINILYVNINSIRNKIDDLIVYMSNFQSTIHVVCISEMRLSADELHMCNLPDYDAVCCPRSNRSGGGACIFVHNTIGYDVIKNEEFLEGSVIILSLRETKMKVAVIYRPPHAPLIESLEYLDALLECNEKMLCVGDFNINLLQPISQRYLSMLDSNGFACLNRIDREYVTHGQGSSGSIIDHAITDLYGQNFSVNLDDVSFTDHRAMLISFGPSPRHVVDRSLTRHVRYNYDRIFNNIEQSLDRINCFSSLTEVIVSSMSRFSYEVVIDSRRRNKSPWIDETVLREIRIREQLYKRTVQWPENDLIRRNYRNQKNWVTRLIKQKQKMYYQNLIAQNRCNIRMVWKILNQIVFNNNTKVQNKSINEILYDNMILKDTLEISNAFNKFFVRLPHKLARNLESMFNNEEKSYTLGSTVQSSIVWLPVTPNEMSNYIRELNHSSAVGVEGIPIRLIKQNAVTIVPILTDLVNASLEESNFPNCLKTAKVVPIYKNGLKNNLGNYRPISILPALSKPFEKVIHHRLSSFFARNKTIHVNQYGFQPNSSTLSATVNLVNEIQQNIDRRRLCSAIFIDVSKAFDCVPHNLLLKKMQSYGIRGDAIRLIESYLKNRQQCVIVDKSISSLETVQFGVPQGSILGPLLFIVFINDIFELPLKGKLQLFADDASIVYKGNNIDTLFEDMQHDMNLIQRWFYNNGLTINVAKTKYVIFSSTDRFNDVTHNLFLGQERVERVENVNYLGLMLQQNLKWNIHVDQVHRKIVKFLGILRRSSHMLPEKEKKNLFYAHVHSQICYLNIIWQNAPHYVMNKITVTLNKFMRVIFWEQYLDPNVRTLDLYKNNHVLSFSQINFFESTLFMFKLKHNLIKHNLDLRSYSELHRYNTRNVENFSLVTPRTNYLRFGCIYQAISNFNSLPLNLKQISSLYNFKNELKQFVMDYIV